MAYVTGFLPWVLYWVLVGNANFRLTICIVLAAAATIQIINWRRGQPWRSLEVGSLLIFGLLAVTAFVVDDAVLEVWLQPLSNLGLFLVGLVGMLVGRPFVYDFAVSTVDAATAQSDGFRYITSAMTWLWIVAFGLMTAVSALPPLVGGDASIRDEFQLLSVLCYWVIPSALLGVVGVVSATFPKWFDTRLALIAQREDLERPAAAAPTAERADSADGPVSLDIPTESGHDEPLDVVVQGVPAGAMVQVSTSGPDLKGNTWRSQASFKARADAPFDLATAAPTVGDWSGADPTAPIWAMRFAASDQAPGLFVPPADPWQVTVQVEVAGVGRARRTVHRRAAAAGVRSKSVSIDGFPGLLFVPAGLAPPGGWPAVACFGGSEGGFASQIGHAALLASHGYAALTASFIEENPKALSSIPLERFLAPFQYLAQHDRVDAGRIAAMAISRGAEGLLAAVSRSQPLGCRGLVLMSPSSMSWQAIGKDGEIPGTPSWTHAGQPVPWARLPTGSLMPQIIRNAWAIKRAVRRHRPTLRRLRPAYEAALQLRGGGQETARIAAERIACPLLILTGGDDAVWPSEHMAEELLQRRAGVAGDQHQRYPAAGHLIRLGNLPVDAQWTSGLLLGGSRQGQAAAQSDATARVLAFLQETTSESSTLTASI